MKLIFIERLNYRIVINLTFAHNYQVFITQQLEEQFLARSQRKAEKCAYWLRHVCPLVHT
jgi:hypothetical protein